MAIRKTSTTKTISTPKKPAAKKPTRGNGPGAKSKVTMTLSHDQIASKAYEIWLSKGCPQGQDSANWKEAEAALLRG